MGTTPHCRRSVSSAMTRRLLDLLDRALQRPVGTNQHTEGVDNIQGLAPDGTSAEAALRRLRKDRPDPHERVLAGELSAHGAAVAAGFRSVVSNFLAGRVHVHDAVNSPNVEDHSTRRANVKSHLECRVGAGGDVSPHGCHGVHHDGKACRAYGHG